jgi:protein ImuB
VRDRNDLTGVGAAGAIGRGAVRPEAEAALPGRLACLWVPHFAAAAALREEPDLRHRPLAIVHGVAPARTVVDATDEAWEAGVRPAMPEAAAAARCPGLIARAASGEREGAAQEALLAVALGTSPRVEDGGAGIVYVDLGGLGALHGGEPALGERLARHAGRVGLPACVGVAGSRPAALAAARLGRRVSIVQPGAEGAMLSPASLDLLGLTPELGEVLVRWGVRTLGDLAELPRAGLVARLGAAGLAAQELARGVDPAPFRPYAPPPFYQEVQGLEWEIVSLEQLAAVLHRLLDRLVVRLGIAHVAADQLSLGLGLADGSHSERVVDLAYPMTEAEPMQTLVNLDLEGHPPRAAVVHVTLAARPVRVRAGQSGFWRPAAPAGRELAVVLARLAALVGSANLGSPTPVDSHRSDAFVLEPFALGAEPAIGGACSSGRAGRGVSARAAGSAGARGGSSAATREEPRPPAGPPPARALALRRLRPAWPAAVDIRAGRPAAVSAGSIAGDVLAGAGPWRVSGEWWREEGWARDEWDVALSEGTLCRLVLDRVARAWVVDGVYD